MYQQTLTHDPSLTLDRRRRYALSPRCNGLGSRALQWLNVLVKHPWPIARGNDINQRVATAGKVARRLHSFSPIRRIRLMACLAIVARSVLEPREDVAQRHPMLWRKDDTHAICGIQGCWFDGNEHRDIPCGRTWLRTFVACGTMLLYDRSARTQIRRLLAPRVVLVPTVREEHPLGWRDRMMVERVPMELHVALPQRAHRLRSFQCVLQDIPHRLRGGECTRPRHRGALRGHAPYLTMSIREYHRSLGGTRRAA